MKARDRDTHPTSRSPGLIEPSIRQTIEIASPRIKSAGRSDVVRIVIARDAAAKQSRWMEPFAEFPEDAARRIRFVLTDVDDTLTDGPRLPAATYAAIEALSEAGITVIPVTAAPAGWCDLMCRMWPIGAVIGENGGLCFRHDRESGKAE